MMRWALLLLLAACAAPKPKHESPWVVPVNCERAFMIDEPDYFALVCVKKPPEET